MTGKPMTVEELHKRLRDLFMYAQIKGLSTAQITDTANMEVFALQPANKVQWTTAPGPQTAAMAAPIEPPKYGGEGIVGKASPIVWK